MGYNLGDGMLSESAALPNGAGDTTTSAMDVNPSGTTLDADFRLTAEALTNGELADGETVTYSVESDTDSAFSSPTTEIETLVTQTGAGGSGDDAIDKRFRLPSTAGRYVRVKATKTGAGDASGKTMTLEMLF